MGRSIRIIDCHYIEPEIAASFLVHEGGEAYFVEANTVHAVPRLLRAMEEEGVSGEMVRWIAITHAHLDHAGGAFALAEACPGATVLAHPRAARHLIDPEKLVTSARKVYGDKEFARLYGDIRPIARERVREIGDGEEIPFHGSVLRCIHTRGHANHHFCLVDPLLSGIFTGDSFGIAYPALQQGSLFIFPTTSPTDFDPRAARETMDTIVASGAERAFLTHFGELRDLAAAREQMMEFMDLSERLYREAVEGNEDFEALRRRFAVTLRAKFAEMGKRAGLAMTADDWRLLETDLRLNADGIAFAGTRERSRLAD